jgi:hypothetical protein
MMRLRFLWVLLLCGLSTAHAFEQVEAKSFAGDGFVFPDQVSGSAVHLLFLSIATDQDNGTAQGDALIEWHKALNEAGAINAKVLAWHFPVIENPPFFVKGLIRRGIAKSYAELLPPEQGAVLFVKNIQRFADAAGVEFDGQPTLMLYTEGRQIIGVYRGDVNDADVAEIVEQLALSRGEQEQSAD